MNTNGINPSTQEFTEFHVDPNENIKFKRS
jgi:hypothetical protein